MSRPSRLRASQRYKGRPDKAGASKGTTKPRFVEAQGGELARRVTCAAFRGGDEVGRVAGPALIQNGEG